MDIIKILTKLCALAGVSGREGAILEYALELLREYCDEVYTSDKKTAVGIIKGENPELKIMLDAHIDRVGFIVRSVEEGFVRFNSRGGIDPRLLQSKEVYVCASSGNLPGIICSIPPHLSTAEEREKVTEIEDMMIDIGLDDETAKSLIRPGDSIIYASEPRMLKNNIFASAAIDDRGCFLSLLYAAEYLKGRKLKADLYIVGSSQEEVTGLGAHSAASIIRPDIAVAVDVDHATTPDAPPLRTHPAGQGAVIATGPHLHKGVTESLIKAAKDNNLPFRITAEEGFTGTNASHIYKTGLGVATGLISLPLKYMHTPAEVVDVVDIEAVGSILGEYLLTFACENGGIA